MAMARSMIPAKYNILTAAYRTLLPDLPGDMYPAFLQAVFDHDVGLGTYKIADFSVRQLTSSSTMVDANTLIARKHRIPLHRPPLRQ